MLKYAFISRLVSNPEQVALAASRNIRLMSIMDMDGFNVTPDAVRQRAGEQVDGVIVECPAMALRLRKHFDVGIFEGTRALHIFPRDRGEAAGFERGVRYADEYGW